MIDKISIIVPVYNCEKYIADCIKSILAQTHKNWELILVDDESNDASANICSQYTDDERIRLYCCAHQGVSESRNYGLSKASGKYVVFIDSDDFVKPTMLDTLLSGMPTSDLSMCGYELFDDSSNTVTEKYSCNPLSGSMQNLAININDYLSPPFLLGPCFKMFKLEIIDKYELKFPPELSYGEDAVFVFKYLMCCKTVEILPNIEYSYRKHGSTSLSSKFLVKKIDINNQITDLINKFLLKQGIQNTEEITSDKFFENFVSYTKELVNSNLTFSQKKNIFYDKFSKYSSGFSKPQRLAQKIIITAGKHKTMYWLIYLFKNRK